MYVTPYRIFLIIFSLDLVIYRQIVGIPIGTNYGSLVANLLAIGELIVYRWSRRLCVRASVRLSVRACVNTFKHEYLCNQLTDWNEFLSEASLGWGKGFSRF